MPYLNEHFVMGHVGQDPELKYTPSGTAVANLSVATTEKWKDKKSDEMKEKTTWHRVVLWGKSAEFAGEYVKKGNLVLVKAPSYTREWEDSNGVKRYTTELTCTRYEHFSLLQGEQRGAAQGNKPAAAPQQDYDDDIPY